MIHWRLPLCNNDGILVLAFLALLVTWTFFQAIRNIFWHPLSKFPGPRRFAASSIPYVHASFNGRLAIKLRDLHNQYGPVVRTAPNELSFIDPSAWKTIYDRKNRHQTPFRKNYDSFSETRSQIRRSLYLAEDQEHARMRKVLSHAFSPEALRNQEPLLQRHVQELIQELDWDRLNSEGIVDLEKWYSWIAFDMVADNSFGEPISCVLEPDHRSWPLILSRVRKIVTGISGLKSISPSMSLFRWVLPISILQKSVLQYVVNRLAFDLDKVKDRIASKPSRGDILSSIVQHNQESRSLDNTEIVANASLFVLAGTETVATLLAALTYLLTQNPGALKTLAKEIRETFKDERLLTVQALTHTTYLNACIEEAMRLVPPVPEGLPRVTPPEGERICGQWVPGGTFVQVSTLAANLSSSNFTDPLLFIPERWLANSPHSCTSDRKQAFQPFSTGPRNCIGQALALSEVRLVIARIIRRYDMRCVMQQYWTNQRTYLLWDRKPLLVELIPVRDGALENK